MLKNYFLSFVGKSVGQISRIKGGHGSALPGLVVEKISPNFLAKNLAKLPHGVVVVSGTNGKTTTTKILAKILRDQNLKVFTNPSGSNFTRGVSSEIIRQMRHGKLDADIAVLELDEAHAVHFVKKIPPHISLILNVFRDQLDRFGEIDTTTKLLKKVASSTQKTVILNSRDPETLKIAREISSAKSPKIKFFGFCENLQKYFPSDDDWHSEKNSKKSFTKEKKQKNLVDLKNISKNSAKYRIGEQIFTAHFQLSGAHNFLNSAAALSAAKEILGENFDAEKAVESIEKIRPAFGRGEIFSIKNREIEKYFAKIAPKKSLKNAGFQDKKSLEFGEKITNMKLILVKNPSGFQASLNEAEKIPTLIAINDRAADGHDVSWLYDVDFAKISDNEKIFTAGIRSSDMALRLFYSDIFAREISEISHKKSDFESENFIAKISLLNKKTPRFFSQIFEKSARKKVEKRYDKKLQNDLLEFLKISGAKKQIFATYTAMLKIREILKKIGDEK